LSADVFDIVWVRLPVGASRDIRPCVVIRVEANGAVTLVRISSAMDLFDPRTHFRFEPTHPDFAATGLRKESFCDDSKFFNVHVNNLGKRMGSITGDLQREFAKWLGLTLG